MAKITRRRFFYQASTGAAAVGVLSAVPRLLSPHAESSAAAVARASGTAATPALAGASAQPAKHVVAYVHDHAKGEVAILVDTREVIRHDPELVARLMQAAG